MTILDFFAYIIDHARDFVGREWVFAEIDAWLADPDAPRFFIITGEPGIGKTAIAARLTQIRDLDAYHFCIARQADTIDPLNFARSLSHQLTRIDGFARDILEGQGVHVDVTINARENYGQIIGVQIENLVVEAPSSVVAFNRAVLDPLRRLYADGFDQQMVILVDALDEAVQQRGPETIVDLLANARGLPSRVRFVLTSRLEGGALRHFERLNIPHLVLEAGGTENQADVQAYVRYRLENSDALRLRLTEEAVEPNIFVEWVTKASRGNFLYLVWLLPVIVEGTQQLDALEALPKGLDGVYCEFLRTRKISDVERWRNFYRPVVGVLAAAKAPLTAELLMHFTNLRKQELADSLRDVRQFLNPTQAEQGLYQLYHQSVTDFLSDEVKAEEFWIDLEAIHHCIVEYYYNYHAPNWHTCDLYGLRYLPAHLAANRDWTHLTELLTDLDFLRAKCAAGMTFELTADYNAALAELPECSLIMPWARFFQMAAGRIASGEENLLPLAYNYAADGPVASSAKGLMDEGRFPAIWLQRINRPPYIDDSPCLRTLDTFGHSIRRAKWSPSGDKVLSLSEDNLVRAWEADTGRLLRALAGHQGRILDVDWHPTNETVALSDTSGNVQVWDVLTGKTDPVLREFPYAVTHCVWNTDGTQLLIGCQDGSVRSFAVDEGRWQCKSLEGHLRALTVVTWCPRGRRYISASEDRTIHLVDVEASGSLASLHGVHTRKVAACAWSPDGERAVTAGQDRRLAIWDLRNPEEALLQWLDDCGHRPRDCAWNPRFPCIVSVGAPNHILIWFYNEDNESRKRLEFTGHKGPVLSCAWDASGRYLATASQDKTVRIWDIEDRKPLQVLTEHKETVSFVSWHPNPGLSRVLSASDDGTLGIWQSKMFEPLPDITKTRVSVHCCSWSPDGRIVAAGNSDGRIVLFRAKDGKENHSFDAHSPEEVMTSAWSTDGKHLLSGGCDRFAMIWDLSKGLEDPKVLESDHWVTACAWNPIHPQVVIANQIGNVVVRDISQDAEVATVSYYPSAINCCAYSPSGDRIAFACSDGYVRVWSWNEKKKQSIDLAGHKGSVEHCRWSHDDQSIISCGDEGETRIWSGRDFSKCEVLEHPTSVASCAWIGQDKWVVTSCSDHRVRVWDLKSHEVIAVYNAGCSLEVFDVSPDMGVIFGFDTEGQPIILAIRNSRGMPAWYREGNNDTGQMDTKCK